MSRRARPGLLWACAVASSVPLFGQGVNFYSLEKEQALGRALAADIRRETPAVEDAWLQGYVSSILERVQLFARSPLPVTVELLPGGKPSSEPIALPGGPLFVPLGMILAADNESDLAGALAHGLAHIAERHATRMATRGQLVNLSTIPLVFLGGWSPDREEGQALLPAGFREFQRRNEAEADRLAAQWMAQAGYTPAAYAAFLERLQPPSLQPVGERGAAIRKMPGPETVEETGRFAEARRRAEALVAPVERAEEARPPSLRRPRLRR